MENFRNLVVWQRAMSLAVRIAKETRQLPYYERDELGRHMRRSARSVHANIAESSGRKVAGGSNADGLRCLAIASGELHELDSDVEYAMRAAYWAEALARPILDEIQEVRRLLAGFIAYRRRKDKTLQTSTRVDGGTSRTAAAQPLSTRQPVNLAAPLPGPAPPAA